MRRRRFGGVMNDQQSLSLKEMFDIYNSTLRLVGAANATGAIAAGAAFSGVRENTGGAAIDLNMLPLYFS
jgi:hypothetical protein